MWWHCRPALGTDIGAWRSYGARDIMQKHNYWIRYITWRRWMIHDDTHITQEKPTSSCPSSPGFFNRASSSIVTTLRAFRKTTHVLAYQPTPPLFTPFSCNKWYVCSQRQLKQEVLRQSSTIMDQIRDQINLHLNFIWSFINHQTLHQASRINKTTLMKTVPHWAIALEPMEGRGGLGLVGSVQEWRDDMFQQGQYRTIL